MRAVKVVVHNPFQPALGREVTVLRRRRRIATLAPRTQQPCICIHNGEPLLRRRWRKTCVRDGDVVAFVMLPQGGGGGSNPLKIILSIALAAVAPGLAGVIGTAIGITSQIGLQIIGGAIAFAGNMLLNALLPAPTPPAPFRPGSSALPAPSPTYSLQAQGNRARLSEPIPVIYGRHLIYPDFAAEPYAEFAGNEQYLYQLFVIGQGDYSIEAIRIEDTPISSFPEITYEVIGPGGLVTLFPADVVTSPEVSGQELTYNVIAGPFVALPPGTKANALACDIVFPKGLFYANDSGGLDARSVTVTFEARTIDGNGVATGAWTILGAQTVTAATNTPQRYSYRYPVAEARYEVRATRTSTKDGSSRAGHDVHWAGLRAYLPGTQQYGNVTLIAMRMRASNSLSAQSSRKVNLIVTRKLPIWNGATWSAPAATRSIAWALADICRAEYGAKLPDQRVDLARLLALDATLAARADYCDVVVDSRMTIWDALTTVARLGRAKPYMQGGIVHFFRDQAATLPVALFTQRNIVRGSLEVEYVPPTDETVDAVNVEYFDADVWAPREVLAKLPDSTALKPAKLKLVGATGRAHAWREGMHTAAQNRYRRQLIRLLTEMEGYIPTVGDLIAIAHARPKWGTSGDVTAYNAATREVTVSEPLTWTAGATHYFGFRRRDGGMSGPWSATAGADSYRAVLAAALDFTPYTGLAEERTHFSFGPGQDSRKLARVVSLKPRDIEHVEIVSVNEDDAVHTADTSASPPASTQWNLPAVLTRPVVAGLNVTLAGTAARPLLLVSWLPAAGADHYYVERTYDGGNTWSRLGDTAANNYAFPAHGAGSVHLRVAGMGLALGAWAQWQGDPYAAPPPDVTQFLVTRQADGTREFTWSMPSPPPDLAGYKIRYRTGTGWTWAQMNDLHAGLLTASPYETNQLAAGTYTLAIKAVDTSGNESQNAAFITTTLGDPRLAGVILHALPHTDGWPGTKTDCHVEPASGVLSADDAVTWAGMTTWSAWARWNVTPKSPIVYQHTTFDLGGKTVFRPLVTFSADGAVTVDEQHSDDNVGWSAWAVAGALIDARYIRFRITVTGAFPRVTLLDIKLSGTSQTEEINDRATATLTGAYRIGVGDIRLPIKKAYTVITQVQVALQSVGAGWSWEVIDKDKTVGPRIKIYNASNALADATIDALIRGY